MTPRVSVVIPTFNRAELIGAAIDSVLAQTFSDYEIVVADDGSTDDTASRVAAYGARVRYVRTENGGVAHARNVGTQAARGAYLAYLDSDDRLYPYALELQTALLDRFPEAAFACAEMSGFDDHGYFERYHLKTYHASAYRDPAATYDRIFRQSMTLAEALPVPAALLAHDQEAKSRRVHLGNVFDVYLLKTILCQNSILVRREILEEAGLRNPRVRHWQEVDFLLRICRRHSICFVDVPTYQLRYHDGQISSTGGARGKDVWARKQRILLRVTKRHALADDIYYQQHRRAIDTHLSHLHRAAAVPLLLANSAAASRVGYAKRARAYLLRCGRHGASVDLLWLASYLPGPLRRFAVTAIERLRRARSGVATRLAGGRPTFYGSWRALALGVAAIGSILLLENLGASPLNRLLLWLPGVDKVLHTAQSFVIFRVLYWLLAGRTSTESKRALVAGIGAAIFACFDEIQQAVMPGRSVEFADIGASVAGAMLGAASVVVHRAARVAVVMAACAAMTSGWITYSSYSMTKDYKLGLRLEADGRYAEAKVAFERALKAGFENAELLNSLAWANLQSGVRDPEESVALAGRSLLLRPGDPNTLDTYGWALYTSGRFLEAVAPLEKALAQDPEIYCVHYHLGATYLQLGDRPSAESHLRAQVAHFPAAEESTRAAALLEKMDAR